MCSNQKTKHALPTGSTRSVLISKRYKIESCASLGFIPLVVYSRVKRALR